MKQVLASILCLAIAIAAMPTAFAAVRSQTGEISGVAKLEGKAIPNVTVRLRNVDTSVLVATTKANGLGEFKFTGLPPGNFVVEIVQDDGKIIGTLPVSLTAAAMVAGNLTVTASAVMATAAAGTGLGTGVLVATIVAATLVTTGIVVATKDASPSR